MKLHTEKPSQNHAGECGPPTVQPKSPQKHTIFPSYNQAHVDHVFNAVDKLALGKQVKKMMKYQYQYHYVLQTWFRPGFRGPPVWSAMVNITIEDNDIDGYGEICWIVLQEWDSCIAVYIGVSWGHNIDRGSQPFCP